MSLKNNTKEDQARDPNHARNENDRLQGDLKTISTRISHDLRTPLGSIMNTGELLRELLTQSDPAASEHTAPLFSSVEELMQLIRRLSLITKASANPVTMETVQMAEVVTDALQRLEHRMVNQGAQVDRSDSWPQVTGVRSWLEVIWSNFLTNALRHGGPKIKLGWERGNLGHKFWICDNGLGVPAPSQAKLFQPFETLHQPDSTRGLGLSIVRRLVELQGGHCGYETASEASCFFFTLPHPSGT
jgi:signal transduction histidine kinase